MIETKQLDRPGTKKFNAEFTKAIKALMKRDIDPTPEKIFDYFRCHPGDFPHITRLRTLGMEDHLKVYLIMWGKMKERIKRSSADQGQGELPHIHNPAGGFFPHEGD